MSETWAYAEDLLQHGHMHSNTCLVVKGAKKVICNPSVMAVERLLVVLTSD